MVKLYQHSSRLLFMTFFAVFSGFILSDAKVSADNTDVIDEVSITVPESCTMSGTGMNTHNAEISNNIYTTDIGTTTLHAFCNDSGGFAIYAAGYTGNEIGGANSTKLVGSPSAIGNIDTGTATSGNTSNWAMKVTKTQDSGDTSGDNAFTIDNSFNDYHAVPSSFTKVVHKNTVTDMTASTGGVKLTTTYATFISGTQPAGTYSGQVKYTLVHPATETPLQPVNTPSGYISYNPNASSVIDTMGDQTITSSDTTANLWASNFQRPGYGFAGWSETYDYSDPAKFYGPNETISFTAGQYSGTNKGLSLYAIWVKSTGNLQNWTECNGLNIGDVIALTDQRNNETYAVAKLADGNCWIIENLRLDNTNADNSTGTLSQGYHTSFSGLADPESNNFTSSTSSTGATPANSLYYAGTQSGTATIDIKQKNYAGFRMPRYNNQNTSSPISNMTSWSNNDNIYSIGNWYTWSAAIADTSYYSASNQSITTTSICPAGWHLPTGGSVTANFSTLDKAMGGTGGYQNTVESSLRWRKYPNNFIYSGYFNNSAPYERSSDGYYWAATVSGNYYAYNLWLKATQVDPQTNTLGKTLGQSIRCLTN